MEKLCWASAGVTAIASKTKDRSNTGTLAFLITLLLAASGAALIQTLC
jgi:hypothetical protein